MKAEMNRQARYLPAVLLFALAPASACSVDFDGYVFDDKKLAEEEGGDGDKASPVASVECVQFCDDQEEICGFEEERRYESKNDCLTLCAGYFESELSCRITHLDFARDGAATHCPHTIEDGGNTCPDARTTSCDRFCLRANVACPFNDDAGDVYPSARACNDACAAFGDEGLECRFIELGKAEENASECENLLPGSAACAEVDNN